MKLDAVLSYILSILEGGLSGVCFYRAGRTKDKKYRIFFYIASAAWFILSVLDGIEGSRTLREARMTAPGEEEAAA